MQRRSFLKSVLMIPAAAAVPWSIQKLAPKVEPPKVEGGIVPGNEVSLGPRAFPYQEMSFETFKEVQSNSFALAAAKAVASSRGHSNYHPLVLVAPVGMGKTHLMTAIANHVVVASHGVRLQYFTVDGFFAKWARGLRRLEMDAFRKDLREETDVLFIDGMQRIGMNESMQNELFETMEYFKHQGKLVVVSLDCYPKYVERISERMRSVLEGGLIAEIHSPSRQELKSILEFKAKRKGLVISPDLKELILANEVGSIRGVEGNLLKLQHWEELNGRVCGLTDAKKILV